VTGRKSLPAELVAQIVARTDGVPLFIEELTKTVLESGIVIEEGDRYALAQPLTPLTIPTTLEGSLLARLDRLPTTREVVQIGAALGRRFSHELISAIAMVPEPQLNDAMTQLVGSGLVFQRGTPPDAEYMFKHALVQDAAYATLLRSRRQQIHARIVSTLENQFTELVTNQPQVIAHHCVEAGLNEKAVAYWLKSGQLAVARSAMTEAVAQLQKGLDLLAGLPDSPWRREHELELRIALGQALIGAKGYAAPAVGEVFARAHVLAVQLNRSDHIVPLLWGQWTFHLARSELRLALSLAERIEQIGEAEDNVVLRLLGYRVHGMTCFHLGEFVAALALFERCHGLNDPAHRAVDAAQSAEDPYAVVLAYLAQTLTALGCLDQGRARINEALREAHAGTRAAPGGLD